MEMRKFSFQFGTQYKAKERRFDYTAQVSRFTQRAHEKEQSALTESAGYLGGRVASPKPNAEWSAAATLRLRILQHRKLPAGC
jgi:hypothetical protein